MGNSASAAARGSLAVNTLAELGENEVQYEKSMGSSRFLKAVRARHTDGRIVVKTFVKPDGSLPLRHLFRRLKKERETLANVPNVLTYQQTRETDRAGYLIRQWVSSSLYDRISTRPFLTCVEKKWITYQLLYAMKASREKDIPHGDLKTENVLVTSSLSAFVTDFAASFKPTFLPLDDPADFSFFFDTSGRRTCYVAPERFYSAGSDIARQKASLRTGASSAGAASSSAGNTSITSSGDPYGEILGLGKRDGKVTEAMDVFSLGCVISELWRDGTPMFSLSQLFKYREGRFDLEVSLAEIHEPAVRSMVREMLSIDPTHRPSFAQCIVRPDLFPSTFSNFLHLYLVDLQRYHPTASSLLREQQTVASTSLTVASQRSSSDLERRSPNSEDPALETQRQADLRLEHLYEEWAIVVRHLSSDSVITEDQPQAYADNLDGNDLLIEGIADDAEHILPIQLHIPRIGSSRLNDHYSHNSEDGSGLIVLSVILSNLRNALRSSSKVNALDLVLHLSAGWLTDESKLDRVLPYLISLLDDPNATVRAAAVRSTVQILLLVRSITPANESVCLEYIFPNLRRIASDASTIVRRVYASCFPTLISCAQRFLQQTQALRASGAFVADQELFEDFDPQSEEASFDAQLEDIRSFAQEQVAGLLTDSDPSVKRSLLRGIKELCPLLGKATTNDVLLSHMITYLNDRDWQLRDAFFEAIADLSNVAGSRSVEEYIAPLMMQALSDAEDFVVVRVLAGLSRLVMSSSSLLANDQIFDLVAATSGFLCHSNLWIRQAAARFLADATARLDSTDAWAIVYPSIRPLLKHELERLSALTILSSVKPPLSRDILQAALNWAATANRTAFWKGGEKDAFAGKADTCNVMVLEGLRLLGRSAKSQSQSVSKINLPRSDEDDGFMDKLRALGFSRDDEVKLIGLRDYIWRVSKHFGRQRLGLADENSGVSPRQPSEVVELSGITPQTIFFSFNKGKRSSVADPAEADQQRLGSARSPTVRSFSEQIAQKRIGAMRNFSGGSMDMRLSDPKRRSSVSVVSSQGDGPSKVRHPTRPVSLVGPESSAISLASQRSSSGQARLGPIKAAPAAVAESSTNATGTMADLAARLRSLNMTSASASATPTAADSNTPTLRGEPTSGPLGEITEIDEPIFRSTYEGSDQYIQAHLEMIFVKNFRSRSAKLGPRVGAGPASRRRGGKTSLSPAGVIREAVGSDNSPTPAGGSRRPEGKLVAYFNEHSGPITAVAVSPDHAFFASGSEDGTIKIWDTARLEKNVTSRSRTTYSGHSGQISALIALESTHCFASAATDGSLHVWRVDLSSASLPRYGKPRLVSNFQLSTPQEYVVSLLQSSSDSPSATLVLGTSQSRITILDLRTMQVLQALRNPPHFGPITCMCKDKQGIWLLAGTLGGSMVLWDLRFGLLVKSWRVGSSSDSHSPGVVKVTGCCLHPSKGRGRWVMITYERPHRDRSSVQTLVETWDIDRGVVVELYEVITGNSTAINKKSSTREVATGSVGLSSATAAIQELVQSREAHYAELVDGREGDHKTVGVSQSCHVKCFIARTEGYASGSLGGSSQVSGGWLDAGKLAAEADGAGEGGAGAMADGRGPAGYLITAGEDCKIRFWDMGKPERSVCVGLAENGKGEFKMMSPEGGESFRLVHDQQTASSSTGREASDLRSPLLSPHQNQQAQAYMRAHRDAITALAIVESPFRCIVAGDRTGAIKVWE